MKLTPDEISPITGNLSVFVEWDENVQQYTRLCMESGYHTYDSWKVGDKSIELFELHSPKFIIDSKKIAGDQVWYKVTLLTEGCVLCPEQDNIWIVNSFRNLEENESFNPETMIKKVLIDESGNEQIQVIDSKFEMAFPETSFEAALSEFYKRLS